MKRLLAAPTMMTALTSGVVWAQEKEAVNIGEDPTKPLTRFDLRYKYQNPLPCDHDNAHITPRMDKPFVLVPGWSLATRLDFPLFVTEAVSPDNPDGGYEFKEKQNEPLLRISEKILALTTEAHALTGELHQVMEQGGPGQAGVV